MESFTKLMLSSKMNNLSCTLRWNGKNVNKGENVAEHSHFVTWVTRIICEHLFIGGNSTEAKLDAVTFAIFHEIDEIYSGDVLHNLKYNEFNGYDIRMAIDTYVSKMVMEDFGGDSKHSDMIMNKVMSPNLTTKHIVKIADWMAMVYFCYREVLMGNSSMSDSSVYCSKKLNDYCDLVIEYFQSGIMFPFAIDISILKEIKEIQWNKMN